MAAPATEAAIKAIRKLITDGELGPGTRLPAEPELAAQLGLSRGTLREAVRALVTARVLDVRRGDGTYVTSLEPQVLLDTLTFVVDFHRDDSVLEFLRVRRILEPAAAAMAAQQIDDAALAVLQRVVDASSPDAEPEELFALDAEFHRLIGVASGNSVLASLIEGLSGPTNRARVWRGRTEVGAQERTVREHQAILDALAAHAPDVAQAAMVGHVAGVENWLRRAR